jgi:cobalt/nickel transport system permease protein
MHISEGVLSGPVFLTGGVLAAVGTAVGLKKMDYDRIAQVGILASAFFVASLVHVNIGPSSVHLILNGIVGLMLGWAAFPAILVALALQAVFFQYGGITALGINTLIMAFPAVLCFYLFGSLIKKKHFIAMAASFACGFFSVLFTAVMLGGALIFTQENLQEVSFLVVMANLPVMIIDGIITAFCVAFLKKVHPEILYGFR